MHVLYIFARIDETTVQDRAERYLLVGPFAARERGGYKINCEGFKSKREGK